MIFGYISKEEPTWIESYIKEKYPNGVEIACQYKEGRAWFFTNNTQFDFCQYYEDESRVLLFEGIPIIGSYNTGYKIIDAIRKSDIDNGFLNLIKEIASNVSVIFFEKESRRLYLASDRANVNRIYYEYVDGTLIFSSSFSILSRLNLPKINYVAIYSILKFGCIPPPISLFEQIYVVPPAHFIIFNFSKLEFEYPYFKFSFSGEHGTDLDTLNTILNATSQVLGQLDGALLLSGGVDSTLLAHKIHERSTNTIRAYFLALDKNDPERVYAEEAAKSVNAQFNTVFMNEDKLPEIIYEIAESYDYPFNDFSTIPTYFLFKEVVNKGEKIIIDGTGADGCFGFGAIGPDKAPYIIAHSLPFFIKKITHILYSRTELWKKESTLETALRTIAKYYEVNDVNLGPLIMVPSNNIFPYMPKYNESLEKLIVNLIDSLIQSSSSKTFEERATVADLIFSAAAKMAEKTHLREKFPNVYTVYPFLWRDILEEQGKISWSAKINNGIIKWPLKKLLEPYMLKSFIYRKKAAPTPNFEKYIKTRKVYQLFQENLLKNHNNIFNNIFNGNLLSMFINDLLDIYDYSLSLCHFLWGMIFITLWFQKLFTQVPYE
jgi:asparagine synthase (glutamine-hydrolysing)